MRRWAADLGLMVLVAGAVGGCSTAMTETEMVGGGGREATFESAMPYLVATRAILEDLRQRYGFNAVFHEIWPDLQAANVHVSRIGRDGLLLSIGVRAHDENRCTVTLRCSHGEWYRELEPRIRKILLIRPL